MRRILTVLISITVPALLLAQLLAFDIASASVGLPATLGLAGVGCAFGSRRTLAGTERCGQCAPGTRT